jgi:hypothetical protein
MRARWKDSPNKEIEMKRGCLLWLVGVPLPLVLILYFLFFR